MHSSGQRFFWFWNLLETLFSLYLIALSAPSTTAFSILAFFTSSLALLIGPTFSYSFLYFFLYWYCYISSYIFFTCYCYISIPCFLALTIGLYLLVHLDREVPQDLGFLITHGFCWIPSLVLEGSNLHTLYFLINNASCFIMSFSKLCMV